MRPAPHQKLVQYWADTESDVRVNATPEADIAALEAKYGVQLPPEFKAYLLEACPRADQVDQNCTEWWSLERIKSIPAEYEHALTNEEIARDAAGYLFFADYAIWCMAWAICCRPGHNFGRVVVTSGKDRFVADSFSAFIDAYISDHRDLL